MKVIIDTNVLVSGIFFGGIPKEILLTWKSGLFTLVISHDILEEYLETVQELQNKYPTVKALEIVQTIAVTSEITYSLILKEQICEDPDDDKFLAAALASKTKIIVSGDKLLKKVYGWSGISVLSPRKFYDDYIKS